MKNLITSFFCCLIILSACSTPSQKAETASCEADKASMEVVMSFERKIKPENVSAYKASFEKCKVGTMAEEPGCLYYAMFQSYTDSTVFMIVEAWKNKGEHIKHMETEHLKVHIGEIKDMGEPGFKGYSSEVYVCPNVN